jgi:hypothetical protein
MIIGEDIYAEHIYSNYERNIGVAASRRNLQHIKSFYSKGIPDGISELLQ